MAGNIILELEGVEGESEDSVLKAKIDISSFSWGLSNMAAGSLGKGSSAGTADLADISLQKTMDKSSTMLFINCAKGQHHPTATLHIRKTGGDDTPKDYLKYTLNEVYITSYSTGGSEGGGLPSESFSLNYAKIKMEYFIQDADGIMQPAGEQTYDVKQNKKV